jgi:vacuolar protein sorting-associated protein 54
MLSTATTAYLPAVDTKQAKSFLQAFHQDRISRSARLVEDELWNPSEVPQMVQHLVKTIVEAAVRDPPELVVGADPPQLSVPNSPTVASTPSSPISGRVSKHLRVEGISYFAVSATLETLVLLLDYLKIIMNLSMLTTDTMSRIIEFLKAFNSRTCQVVLGAGAMRSAGLRVITAKHLGTFDPSMQKGVPTNALPSTRISIIVYRHRAGAVCSGDVQETLEPPTGSDADRVRPT